MQVCPPTGAFRMVKSSDESFFKLYLGQLLYYCHFFTTSHKHSWHRYYASYGLLYNKTLNKHVTALFCLYLGNVNTSANHFRNAPVGGHTCLTAGEQGEPADWGLQLCFSIGPRRRTHNNWIYNKLLNLSGCFPLTSLF